MSKERKLLLIMLNTKRNNVDIKASMFISRQAQSFPEVDLLTQSSHGKFDTKTS